MKNRKEIILSVVLLTLFIVLISGLVIDLYPLLKRVISDSGNEEEIVSYIRTFGSKGVVSLVGLQALQSILVFVPSAIIQILAGLCYGILWGSSISLLGFALGNTIIFLGIRQFRKTFELFFTSRVRPPKAKEHFFDLIKIKTMKRPELLVFFGYLIPAVPSGVLPYVFAQSKISFTKYLISMTLASIPSILIWTWLGDSVLKKNYRLIVILVIALLFIFLMSLLFKKRIQLLLRQLTK